MNEELQDFGEVDIPDEVTEPTEEPQDDLTGGETELPAAETESAIQSEERTSKQPPEVDAAFARARRAEEELAKRDQWVQQTYGQHGINTWDQLQEAARQQQMQAEAERMAEREGISAELAQEMLTYRQELQSLKQRDAYRDAELRNIQQKAVLKDKPLFAELEADIDKIVALDPRVDVKTAFYHLRGERMDDLLKAKEKEIEQRVLRDLEAKRKGKVIPGSAPKVTPKLDVKNMSTRDLLMARAKELDL